MMISSDAKPCLFVVDDDDHARESIDDLVKSLQIPCRSFTSAESLLAEYNSSWHGGLLIDYHLRGMDGLELQQKLVDLGCRMPVILISGDIDVRSAVKAMNQGALTVLEKPYDLDQLLDAIRHALALDSHHREEQAAREKLERQLSQLTLRERQVMELLAECTPRKTIARQLGMSHRTAERLCAKVYEKTETDSPVALSRFLAASRNLNDGT
jgi:FixJ family two-component response regulator